MEELKVKIDNKEHVVKIEEGTNSLKVHLDGKVYAVETSLKNEQKDYDISKGPNKAEENTIKAEIPGIIFSVDVKEGAKVSKGQKLISLIAMKMENQVISSIEGTVKEIKVKKDDRVNKGDIFMIIE